MEDIKKIAADSMNNADMVLVGIGEEFGMSLSGMKENLRYKRFLDRVEEREEYGWLVPYVEKLYLREHKDEKIMKAYDRLGKLLEGKNYYIVSTCTDDCIYDAGFKEDRIVTPCGGYRFMQCEDNCRGGIEEPGEALLGQIYHSIKTGEDIVEIKKPVCINCKKNLVFNNVNMCHYAEEGYLDQWNQYTKWLQGTVNRKLCVVELGVGMQFPTIIRWPFEKIVFFNQKSNLFRIHSKLYQLTEEIKERGFSLKENSTDFIINWFV